MAVGQGPEQGQGFAQTAAREMAMRQDISDDSPIRDEIGALHAGIDRLMHQIDRLRAKLDPVLHAIPENESAPMGLAQEPRSQFTEELSRARIRVNDAADAVIRTLDQLDV
jgi:hypothetical protein